MPEAAIPSHVTQYRRAGAFTLLLLLVNLVANGTPGKYAGLPHQFMVLPATLAFVVVAWLFLRTDKEQPVPPQTIWTPRRALTLAAVFEVLSIAIVLYEAHHFVSFGYHLSKAAEIFVTVGFLTATAAMVLGVKLSGRRAFTAATACYAGGMLLAIAAFPLYYLRSDMLPVILWADTNLLHHLSPYTTMYVGGRVYDFPYLPGMLVTYLPLVALHLDLRWLTTLSVVALATMIFATSRRDRRLEVAAVLAVFLTCPFLQYRHELYGQPHWLTLVSVFVLMQRRRYLLAALVFGFSMAMYQFSWIIFPFFLLNALRRKGWGEVLKLTAASAAVGMAIVGPFLSSAYHRIANNTVGQWSHADRADEGPMNLSFWATYLIAPEHLLRLQAGVLIAIFAYCFFRNRCVTLADTLRWMIVALTVFILLNVLVDGYFYLMLLVPMMVYVCVANGWWREFPEPAATTD